MLVDTIIRKYRVKNMFTKCSIKLVTLYFKHIENVDLVCVELGTVELKYQLKKVSQKDIFKHFKELEFDVIETEEDIIVDKIKMAAIELIHYANNVNSLIRNSDYISKRVELPYEKLTKIFSTNTGTTLEKYIIQLKVEKVKELLKRNEYSLSEIAYMLEYSSVQYLSNQFKKITGVTVSQYKASPNRTVTPLGEL